MPSFFKAFPEVGIAGAWAEFKSVQLNPDTALDGKTKELIGLAVASQIPCEYCVYFHTVRRQGQRRDRRGNPRDRRDGGDRAALEHGAQRHAGRPATFKQEVDTVLAHAAEMAKARFNDKSSADPAASGPGDRNRDIVNWRDGRTAMDTKLNG